MDSETKKTVSSSLQTEMFLKTKRKKMISNSPLNHERKKEKAEWKLN